MVDYQGLKDLISAHSFRCRLKIRVGNTGVRRDEHIPDGWKPRVEVLLYTFLLAGNPEEPEKKKKLKERLRKMIWMRKLRGYGA